MIAGQPQMPIASFPDPFGWPGLVCHSAGCVAPTLIFALLPLCLVGLVWPPGCTSGWWWPQMCGQVGQRGLTAPSGAVSDLGKL